jgi:hypothetical protein
MGIENNNELLREQLGKGTVDCTNRQRLLCSLFCFRKCNI